jgi:hypothetical protein
MKHFGSNLREGSNLENRPGQEDNTKMDLIRIDCEDMNLT